MKQFNRKPLFNAISLAVAGSALTALVVMPVHAQDAADRELLEEIIVTSQKRTENLQDVGLSIQVLGEAQLEDLEILGFDDYVIWMPTVSYTSNGPGYGQIYMRGIASGGDGNHSGSMPSVGVYLDEQPVTTINQVLNVHVYDVARIETLAGPQGTLYGQGSQAGTIRIITNKPEVGVTEGGYDIYANTISHGDPGFGLEGFINIPINDRMAVRLVAWHDQQGGYIDNVYGEIDYDASGIHIDNADIVEDNFNTAETTGLRALLKIDLNDNWTLTPGIMWQRGKSEGSWFSNPEYLGDDGELKIVRFFEDWQDEDWYQASVTLEGNVGDLDLVYAGAYMDRDVDSQYDYTGYAEYREYYYAYYGYECYLYDPVEGCRDASQYVDGREQFSRWSHEFRVQSAQDQRFRWIAGLFYQRQEHFFDLQWTVPDMDPAGTVVLGRNVVWQTHQDRVDKDFAIFGEVYFDLLENLTLIGGVREFKWNNSLYGFNGWQGYCTGYYDENGDFVQDDDGEVQYPCFNTGILDDVSKGWDNAWKGSIEWTVAEDKLLYATYSQGFRAGGVNRARVEGIPKYQPDWVYNYELGWKTTWADGQFRFNGAVYLEKWDDFQFGFLDFDISNLTIIYNVGKAETKGIEWQMDWAASENFTLSFQGAYNDSTLQNDIWIDSRDEEAGEPPNATKGSKMPLVPPLQMTGIGRFDFNLGELPAFFQAAVAYRDSTWNKLQSYYPDTEWNTRSERLKIDAYTVVNLSAGIERDNWTFTAYVENLFDERGQIDISDPGYFSPSGFDYTENVIMPRNFGIRWTQRFAGGFEKASPPPAQPPAAPIAPPPANPDLDGDGVLNEKDKCPNTRPGAVVDLDGCEVEAVISLEGVHFEFDQATLTPEAMAILDKAAGLLATQEKVVVEVAGHTDSVGSDAYNQGLSERRAIAVKDYLESKGITATRLTARGYGEAQPVASNDTDEGRALNRRVELIVLSR